MRLVVAALAAFTLLALVMASEPLRATQPRGVPRSVEGADRVVDRVREQFPSTRGWFRIVATAGFTTDASERLVPDYSTLTHPRVRWQDASGHTIAAQFARSFRGATRIASGEDPAAFIDVFPQGGNGSLVQIQDGLIVYPDAYRDTDVLYKSTPTHTDEYLFLRTRDAPTRWSFRVDLGPHIVRLRQAGAAVEAVDARGVPWMRANPPFAVDASGRRVDGRIRLVGDRIVAEIDSASLTPPILVDPDWRSTGDMSYGRFYYGLDELPDGRLLATGGCSSSVCSGDLSLPACRSVLGAAEALDLDTRTWSRLGEANLKSFFHVHEKLLDGNILIAGGCANADCSVVTPLADIWDTRSSSFRAVADLPSAQAGMLSARLPDGRILLAGGCDDASCRVDSVAFNPVTELWEPLAPLNVARGRAAVRVLADGRVLAAGGCSSIVCATTLASAEVYDPDLDRWELVGDMSTARGGHWSATLSDGRVLLGGGCATQDCARVLATAEIFDPATDAFTRTGDQREPRLGAVALTLPDGSVMLSQGCSSATDCDLTNEIWDPASGEFSLIEEAITARAFHQLVLHAGSAQVVAAGGCQPRTCSWWNETYDVSMLMAPDAGMPDAGAVADAGLRDAAALDAAALDA
ncbi:MAG: hypothetical protein GXP55_21475, partial [Deltaproteobacteria bacterium]|nr:hypothetical protein [Deltaproteobacteria bacterium]